MEKTLLALWTALYGLALLFTAVPKTRAWPAVPALAGTGIALAYLAVRWLGAWPMTPMYLGSLAAAPLAVIFGHLALRREKSRSLGLGLIYFLAFALGFLAVIRPKDFYLPFLKTASIFSQLHLIFNFLGKGAFLTAGVLAILALRNRLARPDQSVRLWLGGGFVFWTLSMLAGEIWSYRGWGLPLVWDEAVIVCFMGTWFFYSGILHLFWIGRQNRLRLGLTAAGIGWIFLVNVLPDLGPLRWPPPLR
ncbi:MAG: cytochrome c biogenesis protein [Deltaproteobacteria bacterium]|jgi:hypothetical protein|nr:cytochrome c biogenesis protein [Deltaproteobacteria bacterium]